MSEFDGTMTEFEFEYKRGYRDGSASLAAVTAERDAIALQRNELVAEIVATTKLLRAIEPQLKKQVEDYERAVRAEAEHDALDARCRELEGALSKYADGNNWRHGHRFDPNSERFDGMGYAEALLTPATPAATVKCKRCGDTGRVPNGCNDDRDNCPECVPATPAAKEVSASESLQSDLREVLSLLGLDTGARPYSPHEVMQRDVLPSLRSHIEALAHYQHKVLFPEQYEPAAKAETTETPAFKPTRFVDSEVNHHWQTEPNGRIGFYVHGKRHEDSYYSIEMLTDPSGRFREVPIPDETPAPTCGTCGGTKRVHMAPDGGVADPALYMRPCPACATAEGGVA